MKQMDSDTLFSTLNDVSKILRLLGKSLDAVMTSHHRLPRELVLDLLNISYVFYYKRMMFGTDRIARLLKPFVLPPRHFRDGSAVYVFVAHRSPAFYIGMAIDVQRRIMSHITVSRADARLNRKSAQPDSELHTHIRRTGLGNFSVILLVEFATPVIPEERILAKTSLQQMEAWFIYTLARTHSKTLNIVGTWRNRSRIMKYYRLGTPTIPKHELVSASPGLPVPYAAHTVITQFLTLSGIRLFDFYTVLTTAADSPTRPHDVHSNTVFICHGNLHLSRFRAIRHIFGLSVLRLHGRPGDPVHTILGSDMHSVPTETRRITIVEVVRRRSTMSLDVRSDLARITYDMDFARRFEGECTLLQLHRLYRATGRLKHSRYAVRRACIVKICRRKFGIHPGLKMTMRIRTPLRATRSQLLHSARQAIMQHSILPRPVNVVVCRNLRIVFSRCRRIIDFCDNIRNHCKGYIHPKTRPCVCRNLPDSYWRHPKTGCVVFTSRDYSGPYQDVLQQNCNTVCFPSSDTTMRELQSEVSVLLRRMGRNDDTLPQLTQTWTNQSDPVPPPVDAKRAKELASLLLRTQQLVSGLCDHAKGEMFFSCPHHIDKLIPSAFPLRDTTRFITETRPAQTLIDTVLLPIAQKYHHLAPVRKPTRQRPYQLGVFYALLKTYEPSSPKYRSKLRPINNYTGDPLAPLMGLMGKTLMWLIQQAVDCGVLPWVMTRTEDLVPHLRERMMAALKAYPRHTEQIRWSIRTADAEGFY